jgi:hypothetical protein
MILMKTAILPGAVALTIFYTGAVFARSGWEGKAFLIVWWLTGIFFDVFFFSLAVVALKQRFIKAVQTQH